MASIFEQAPFIEHVGLQVEEVGVGWLVTSMQITDWHRQQHGFVHAGVVATMVDHTQGGAASTVVADGQSVLTAEFKINLLVPGRGRGSGVDVR